MIELFTALRRLSLPLIAAVNGDALMSGFSLVCASDIVVAVEEARLGVTEAGDAYWPMMTPLPLLVRLVRHHALENIVDRDPFDARRAREIGVVSDVVPADRLVAATESWVARATGPGTPSRVRRGVDRTPIPHRWGAQATTQTG